MREECLQANQDCKYFDMQPPPELRRTQEHGCYEDTDHLISQRLGTCALSNYVVRRPENKEQTCRAEHDEKNHREAVTGVDDYPLPPRDILARIVMNDIEAGRQVPRSVRRVLKQERQVTAEQRANLANNYWQQIERRRA